MFHDLKNVNYFCSTKKKNIKGNLFDLYQFSCLYSSYWVQLDFSYENYIFYEIETVIFLRKYVVKYKHKNGNHFSIKN